MGDRLVERVVGGDAQGVEQLGPGEGQGGLAGGISDDRRQQMGAGTAIGKFGARSAHQPPAQDVAHPVAALEHTVPDLVVTAQRGVVAGQPRGHGQQLLEGDLAQPRIRGGGQLVGQELLDGLVQAPQLLVPEGDADQRRNEALGRRADVVAVAGVDALPVALIDQVATADHEHAADLGVEVGDHGVQVVQDRRVHPLLIRGGGPPASRGPVVPLGRYPRWPAGPGRLLAVGTGTCGRQHTPQADNQQPNPATARPSGRTGRRHPARTRTPPPVGSTTAADPLHHDAISPPRLSVVRAPAPTVRFTQPGHKRRRPCKHQSGLESYHSP